METPALMTSDSADASVRPANTADVAAIGAVHSRSWRSAYPDLLPPEILDALEPSTLAESWHPAVTDPPTPRHGVLVACTGPTVVGFTAIDPGGEIVALHVDPLHQRRGHGSRLLSAAVAHLQDVGAQTVHVWCPLEDPARRDFFASAGLAPDSAWRDLLPAASSTTAVREVRLVASIGDAPEGSPKAPTAT